MSERTDTERDPYRMVSWANSGCLALLVVGSAVVIEEAFRIGEHNFSPLMMGIGIAFWGIGAMGSQAVDHWSKKILAREIAKITAKYNTDPEKQR